MREDITAVFKHPRNCMRYLERERRKLKAYIRKLEYSLRKLRKQHALTGRDEASKA